MEQNDEPDQILSEFQRLNTLMAQTRQEMRQAAIGGRETSRYEERMDMLKDTLEDLQERCEHPKSSVERYREQHEGQLITQHHVYCPHCGFSETHRVE